MSNTREAMRESLLLMNLDPEVAEFMEENENYPEMEKRSVRTVLTTFDAQQWSDVTDDMLLGFLTSTFLALEVCKVAMESSGPVETMLTGKAFLFPFMSMQIVNLRTVGDELLRRGAL